MYNFDQIFIEGTFDENGENCCASFTCWAASRAKVQDAITVRTPSLSRPVNHLDRYCLTTLRMLSGFLGPSLFLPIPRFSPLFSLRSRSTARACATSSIRNSRMIALVPGHCVWRNSDQVAGKIDIGLLTKIDSTFKYEFSIVFMEIIIFLHAMYLSSLWF